jgi:hypothetical protein
MVCRALGDAVRGHQIADLIAPLKTRESAQEAENTKWKRFFNAVAAAQNRQGDGRPLIRLVAEVMQPVRFESPADFELHRTAVSERLLLSGYRVREDGKVAWAIAAATLSEAQQRADELHSELLRRDVQQDVLHFCRVELLQHNYFHAVLEASKSVADKLRERSGEQGDGAPLVDKTCSLSSGPIIAFQHAGDRMAAVRTDGARHSPEGPVRDVPQPDRARTEGPVGYVTRRRAGRADTGVNAASPAGRSGRTTRPVARPLRATLRSDVARRRRRASSTARVRALATGPP